MHPLTPTLLLSLLTTSTTAQTTTAQSPTSTLAIGSSRGTIYKYAGCYNETISLPNTTQQRALDGGMTEALPGYMTVARCLEFCATGDDAKTYAFAGLEYSRECWCADKLNVLSAKLDDKECDLPCDGEKGTACGGALKLSLYNGTEGATGGDGGDENGGSDGGSDNNGNGDNGGDSGGDGDADADSGAVRIGGGWGGVVWGLMFGVVLVAL